MKIEREREKKTDREVASERVNKKKLLRCIHISLPLDHSLCLIRVYILFHSGAMLASVPSDSLAPVNGFRGLFQKGQTRTIQRVGNTYTYI